MKILVTICIFVSATSAFAREESAMEIAKRVITDKSSACPHIDFGLPSIVSADVRKPEDDQDDQLADAAKKAHDAMNTFMLSDSVPEKVRIAYAIGILASKRIPKSRWGGALGLDVRKNDGFLKDGIILAARLEEIEKAEQAGADQPATKPADKPPVKDQPSTPTPKGAPR